MHVAAGLSPESAKSGWDVVKDTQRVIFTGIMFGILSYFFFGGAYLKLFGLYSIYDIELLYSLCTNSSSWHLRICQSLNSYFRWKFAPPTYVSAWFIRQLIRSP
jgi:hypothetical protein